MALKSSRSSRKELPRARILSHANEEILLSCGVDPASLPHLTPKLTHRNLLIEGIKLYAANILKQTMLSVGGDVAVHRHVISGRIDRSDCVLMGDLRHYRLLAEKLRLQPGLKCLADIIKDQVFRESTGLELHLCKKNYYWDKCPVIMGILNTTPDSFSDGGMFSDPEKATAHALDMIENGAQIIDVGGESSRPGATTVDADEEMSRVIPIIENIAAKATIPISIDTTKAPVAMAAIDAGACLINDISALQGDPDMLDVATKTGAGVILMHMRGSPYTMQANTHYNDIIHEIYQFLSSRVQHCLDSGLNHSSILVDPGIGFGKDLPGNLKLLKHIEEFKSLGFPVVLGHSRKAFIGSVLDASVENRQVGTDAVSAWAAVNGVDIIRVHDVKHAKEIRSITHSILEST